MYGTILFLYHPFEVLTLLSITSSDEFKCTAQKLDYLTLTSNLTASPDFTLADAESIAARSSPLEESPSMSPTTTNISTLPSFNVISIQAERGRSKSLMVNLKKSYQSLTHRTYYIKLIWKVKNFFYFFYFF